MRDVAAIGKESVGELLKGVDPKAVFSSEGLLSEVKKALAERMPNAELDQHREAEAAAMSECAGTGNHRSGYSKKTIIGAASRAELEIRSKAARRPSTAVPRSCVLIRCFCSNRPSGSPGTPCARTATSSRCRRDGAEPVQTRPHSSEPCRLLNTFLHTVNVGHAVRP
jgi:hypothetical protein